MDHVDWPVHRRSDGRTRHRTEGRQTVQDEGAGDHATGQRRQPYFGFRETPEALVSLTRGSDCDCEPRCRDNGELLVVVARRCSRWEVRPRLAEHTAGSGLGPWYLAKAKALSVGLSNAYFKSLGLPSLFEEC